MTAWRIAPALTPASAVSQHGGPDTEGPHHRQLREVSVVADDPAELRRVAQFFAEAASIVESRRDLDPEAYDGLASDRHLHYRDWTDSWTGESSDLIVIRPRS